MIVAAAMTTIHPTPDMEDIAGAMIITMTRMTMIDMDVDTAEKDITTTIDTK